MIPDRRDVKDRFDITIVGGGMVGTTLAIVLARYRFRVALIEAHPYNEAQPPSFDDRAIAISWGSSRILQQLRLWETMQTLAEPIKTIHVSDRGHFGLTRVRAEVEQVPALGYVISANELGKVLLDDLPVRSSDLFQLFCPARLSAARIREDNVDLNIEQDYHTTSVSTKLLIAADGARSSVRQLLNIGDQQVDYQQNAVVANVQPEIEHRNIAFERFTSSGPIALLPMRSYQGVARCGLIWTLPRDQCQQLMQAGDTLFLNQLQQQFGYRLGRLCVVGRRSAYPLTRVEADTRIAQRVIFIGNAAQTVHPVAGQGFNLALRDLSTLLDCLIHPHVAPDPGNQDLLQRYFELRKTDQRNVIRFTDMLVRTFSHGLPVFSSVRAACLTLLDTLPPVRRRLTRWGMGLKIPLPHL